jgi:hypothetical protein
VRLEWDASYLDVYFATTDLHLDMAERSCLVLGLRYEAKASTPGGRPGPGTGRPVRRSSDPSV